MIRTHVSKKIGRKGARIDKFPTMNDVLEANGETLARWWRYLRSPENDDESAIIELIGSGLRAFQYSRA